MQRLRDVREWRERLGHGHGGRPGAHGSPARKSADAGSGGDEGA